MTQPGIIAKGGMADWSPADWGIFFTVTGGFITAVLVPAVLLVMSKIAGLRANTLASLKQNSDETSKNMDRIVAVANAAMPASAGQVVNVNEPIKPATK
jgi:hypothetical protein